MAGETKPKKTVTDGHCWLCGARITKASMWKHIQNAHTPVQGTEECHVLKIEGAEDRNFWLYVDIPSNKTLRDLDRFLRKIWLECCSHHLSAFRERHWEIAKTRALAGTPVGAQLRYQYDFGSTTELSVSVVALTSREKQRGVVRLLARNTLPTLACSECGQQAELICCECKGSNVESPFFCVGCYEKHEIHEQISLPIVNSPRMGECGFCGECDKWTSPPVPTLEQRN